MTHTLIWRTLAFDALSNSQLYALLQLRSDVFVVEQDCVYQDLDGHDNHAHHVIAQAEGAPDSILACARLIAPGIKYPEASIGRIVTARTLRGTGQGRVLVAKAIEACVQLFPGNDITISAQQHLEKFYAEFEFETRSAPYLEDDIPHIEMTRPTRTEP